MKSFTPYYYLARLALLEVLQVEIAGSKSRSEARSLLSVEMTHEIELRSGNASIGCYHISYYTDCFNPLQARP